MPFVCVVFIRSSDVWKNNQITKNEFSIVNLVHEEGEDPPVFMIHNIILHCIASFLNVSFFECFLVLLAVLLCSNLKKYIDVELVLENQLHWEKPINIILLQSEVWLHVSKRHCYKTNFVKIGKLLDSSHSVCMTASFKKN